MITVIVHHYVLQEQLELAESNIKNNGKLMRDFAGFLSRQTLHAQENPLQITTITTWNSAEELQAWDNRPGRPQPQPDAPTLWSAPIERTAFEVTPEL
jgi:heme-degrading monooxygenase HmoA